MKKMIFFRWLFSWRHFRRVLFVLACLIALIIFFYAEEDFRGWLAWQHFKHEWEAKGERFDFASFIPPPVPDDQNFALTPIVASSYDWILDKNGKLLNPRKTNYIDRLSMSRESSGFYDSVPWPTNYADWQMAKMTDLKEWQNYYRMLAAKTNEFRVAPTPQSPAADVLLALSKYDSTIEELRQASLLPYSRFPLNYSADHPFDVILAHLAALKRCSQVLELRASAELENNQSDKALADVKLMLRLGDSINSEPFLISHLVRNDLTSLAMQPIWEGLVKHKWSDAQLAELEGEFAKLNFLKDYEVSMRAESAVCIAEIDSVRRPRDYQKIAMIWRSTYSLSGGDEEYFALPQGSKMSARLCEFLMQPVVFYLMPDGWYYRSELVVAQMHQQWLLPSIDSNLQLAFPNVKKDADKYYQTLNFMPWDFLPFVFPSGLPSDARKFAFAQNAINMSHLACALERYRLAHNEYPETLDVLAPQFIAQIPHDVIGGKPLHYSRKDGGKFLLYSIGWNEADDGGQIGLSKYDYTDTTKGDWVWPNP
jgi:hypothetical protein